MWVSLPDADLTVCMHASLSAADLAGLREAGGG